MAPLRKVFSGTFGRRPLCLSPSQSHILFICVFIYLLVYFYFCLETQPVSPSRCCIRLTFTGAGLERRRWRREVLPQQEGGVWRHSGRRLAVFRCIRPASIYFSDSSPLFNYCCFFCLSFFLSFSSGAKHNQSVFSVFLCFSLPLRNSTAFFFPLELFLQCNAILLYPPPHTHCLPPPPTPLPLSLHPSCPVPESNSGITTTRTKKKKKREGEAQRQRKNKH